MKTLSGGQGRLALPRPGVHEPPAGPLHHAALAGGQRLEGSDRGDDGVGNPRRARIHQFELFELKFLNSSFSSLSSC